MHGKYLLWLVYLAATGLLVLNLWLIVLKNVDTITIKKQRIHTNTTKNQYTPENISKINEHVYTNTKNQQPVYTILWFNPTFAIENKMSHEDRLFRGFDSCDYKNCYITYEREDVNNSDAVIFHGRKIKPEFEFHRPKGQVWIYYENEAVPYLNYFGGHWKHPPWNNGFNWTMTFDSTTADIYYPYGELREKPALPERNYTAIASQKVKTVLTIVSNCGALSARDRYVKQLQKYIPVKTLGGCGEKWKCGRHYIHDDCFKILNEYKFYLAFENSLCRHYFTEKFFENFEYDTVVITRAGKRGDATGRFPDGAFLSTDSFESVEHLGKHLNFLSSSVEEYAKILRRKDDYYNLGVAAMYKRAMCDICKRMSNQDKYWQTIPDLDKRVHENEPCRKPIDEV